MGSGSHPGFRTWKIAALLTEEQAKKFQLFLVEYRARVLASAFGSNLRLDKPETKYRYVPEMAKAAKHAFNRSDSIRKASRVWPLLNVKFVQGGERLYGKGNASIILDVTRDEIRIPFLGARKNTRIVEKIAGELEQLDPRPKFVAQLRHSRDGMGRDVLIITILTFRTTTIRRGDKALVLAYDINSRYGTSMVVLAIDEEVKLVLTKRYKPPNHGRRRKTAARLQSMGKLEEAARVRMKEKKLNEEFLKSIVADARRIIRHWMTKKYTAYILVDKPEDLRGTSLSGTMNSVAERLENLARYEGAHYLELRASGKYCPVCGRHYITEERRDGKRIFVCPSGHRYDRDFAASWNLVLLYFKSRREQVRRLLQKLGPRALGAPSR